MIQQKIQIKRQQHAADLCLSFIDAVDDQIVQLGDLELKQIDHQKRDDTADKQIQIFYQVYSWV